MRGSSRMRQPIDNEIKPTAQLRLGYLAIAARLSCSALETSLPSNSPRGRAVFVLGFEDLLGKIVEKSLALREALVGLLRK